ncbi:MAG: PIN domain-containing protein [Thiothrix sp.]|jgi:predicted nucleic acid-binding protein|uniref:PIN domain-containing protein n=1 Tax=Thiothrix sp. TaxID=1032 RepID=UPI00262B6DBF|nr:PIN domain-containing protein [Thiothrix sp.]MDD5395577.1 PIN domain-containing protein [Thiothrix sp.]
MLILVDTSIWIDYFRGIGTELDTLIDDNLVATNPVILAELLPAIRLRREHELAALLQEVRCLSLDIQWGNLMQMQLQCLQAGANGIGVADLLIAQNAQQQQCRLYSSDKHFRLMANALALPVYPELLH